MRALDVLSVGLEGVKGHVVRVEAKGRSDKEQFVIVGSPNASIKESKEKVLSCLHVLDVDLDMKKVAVHLSPADKRTTGTGYDAAMLVAVLRECWRSRSRSMTGRASWRPCRSTGGLSSYICNQYQLALESYRYNGQPVPVHHKLLRSSALLFSIMIQFILLAFVLALCSARLTQFQNLSVYVNDLVCC